MIHAIKGMVTKITDHSVIIDNGSMSFMIQTACPNSFPIGQSVHIITHMHWNQEQGPSLFGFATEIERTVFQLIISCSGIGPKIGLAILADLGAKNFLLAIQTSDVQMLKGVSGIGGKKAEQIIVQLKHKITDLFESNIDFSKDESLAQWNTITQVLQSLNYSRQEISNAIGYLNEQPNASQMSFDSLMRHALGFLSKKI